MLCFKCLDAMSKGDVALLEQCKSECQQYRSNQCTHIPRGHGLNQQVFTRVVELFPDKMSAFINSSANIVGACFLAILLSLFLVHSTPYQTLAQAAPQTNATEEILIYGQGLVDNGFAPQAFNELSYMYLHSAFNIVAERDKLFQFLLHISREAESVSPSEMYARLGVENPAAPAIYRITGVVSQIITDPMYGNSVLVSDTVAHERESLLLFVKDTSDIVVGDEVSFVGVPEFVSATQPLAVYGWIQP